MNRGDFRERMKNYTEEPLDSDWSKMAQLLDINEKKKKRRPFFWRIIGAAMLVGAVVASALFFKVKDSPVILPQSQSGQAKLMAEGNQVQEEINLNTDHSKIADEERLQNEPDASEKVKESKPEVKDDKVINTPSNNIQQKITPVSPAKVSSTSFHIESGSTFEEKNRTLQNLVYTPRAIVESSSSKIVNDDKSKNLGTPKVNKELLNGITNISSLPFSVIEFQNQRAEEELSLGFSQRPEVKTYRTASNYLSVGLAASFPKVGLGDSADPFLIPNQSLIPNLGIELGVGRKWSTGMSLELGARTSYFQYRLSNVLSARSASGSFADQAIFLNNAGNEAAQINRHLVVSPYLRIAYDWDILKSSFIGLFAAVGPNFVFELPATNVGGLGNLNLDTNTAQSESISAFDLTKPETSYEVELGLTLGQKVLKTSQITMNFSYGLTMGNLLSGTVFLEQNNERLDSDFYEVKANGPRFKLRYYF